MIRRWAARRTPRTALPLPHTAPAAGSGPAVRFGRLCGGGEIAQSPLGVRLEGTAAQAARGRVLTARADEQSGYTPLHWAVRLQNAEIVKMLVAAGASVNSKAKVRARAGAGFQKRCRGGFACVRCGRRERRGAHRAGPGQDPGDNGYCFEWDPEQEEDFPKHPGWTPLHLAATQGQGESGWSPYGGGQAEEIVKILLAAGADVDAQNDVRDRGCSLGTGPGAGGRADAGGLTLAGGRGRRAIPRRMSRINTCPRLFGR